LTAIPLAGLIALSIATNMTSASNIRWETVWAMPEQHWVLALGAAMVPIFFTYSGWNAAAYLAGEIRNPGRDLARSLLIGAGLVTLVYLVFNVSLILATPREELAGSTTVVADAVRQRLGERGSGALSALIGLAILGSANVTIMAGARIYYAMAVDGLAPRAFSRVNRAGVPAAALWIGGIWTASLSVVADVGRLVGWATLAILLLSSLTVSSLFIFRRRDPRGTTYKCVGYPFVPVLYLAASVGVAIASAINDPLRSLAGIAMVAAGIVLYPLVKRWFRDREIPTIR
jgi:APA family basic amino acid/polyamine antiporter